MADTVIITGEKSIEVVTVGVQGPAGAAYTLTPATNTTLGGVIVGDNLTITGNGVLSAQPGGVTGFNSRTGNVSLTANDVTTALTYTPITKANSTSTVDNLFDTTNGIAFTLPDAYPGPATGGLGIATNSSGAIGIGARLNSDNRTATLLEVGPNSFSTAVQGGTSGEIISVLAHTKDDLTFSQQYGTKQWGDSSLLTRVYADTRYSAANHTHAIANITGLQTALDAKLPSANFTYANLTGTPNLTLYLTTANAASTYQPLGNYATTSCLTFSNITGKPTTLSGYGITDGYGSSNPAGYITSACLTYSNITGTPTLATVATSGSYTDLSNTPTAYSLPTASTTVLGGVKVDGTSVTISNGTISVSTSYASTSANSFTGSQNLQDNELIRAKIRDYSETVSSPTISAGALTLNLENSNIFTVALNAAITTLTISNPPASGSGGSFTLILTADGTARAVTWPASIKWAGGTAPTLTSTSGKVDSFAFFTSDGGTTWQGYIGGQNF